MADVGGNNFMRYIYRGEEGEEIPREATHITVAAGVTFVRARAFQEHPNIVEIICHDKVEKIEHCAFLGCPLLRRVIMLGVKIVQWDAFFQCTALTDVECGKLEIIDEGAFGTCKSLGSINLPSARIVEEIAFAGCEAMVNARFGNKLESFGGAAFLGCESLERITIPLKDGIITADDIFMECGNLKHVHLVEGEVQETITYLQLEGWRNDMNGEIVSINQILSDASAGYYVEEEDNDDDVGEKAQMIRSWIRSVIGKMNHYKAEHQRMLNEATTLLELAIWKANLDDTDESQIVREGVRTTRGSLKRARRELCVTSGASIVIKNVLLFLQLKS